jgi:hypothetical protein
MKKRYFPLFLLGLLVFQSCEKDSPDIFKQDYYYYTFNFEKIPLYLLGSQVFLEFNCIKTNEEIIQFFKKYPYFSDPEPVITSGYKLLRARIDQADTTKLKEILIELNQDTTINYAVPVFTFDRNQPLAFSIPNNDIVCEPLISDLSFKKLISPYNLTILKSMPSDPYYLLKINSIKTGFEPLNIANSLYRTGKFDYCTPDFYASFAPN